MEKWSELWRSLIGGLRLRLLLLVALVSAPFVGLILHTAYEDRRQAEAVWAERAVSLGQQIAQQETKLIASTRQLLIAIAESAPVRAGSQRASHSLMDHLVDSYPRYSNLGVVKTNGEVLASIRPLSGTNLISNLNHAIRTNAFSLATFTGSNDLAYSEVIFSYPVHGSRREPLGVAFAALELNGTSLQNPENVGPRFPKGADWVEVDEQGAVLAAFSRGNPPFASAFTDPWLLKKVFTDRHGTVEVAAKAGEAKFYAFQVIKSKLVPESVALILSIPKEVLFAEADEALQNSLTWLVVAVCISMALGSVGSSLLILKPVRTLARVSERLRGDLRARTGEPYARDELGQLSYAFDQMAQALEHREVQQQKARRKLQVLSRRLVEAQEAERRHIARELHDQVGQALTAASLNLEAAQQSNSAGPTASRLNAAAELVRQVLNQVHDLSLNLRPSMLDDLGLEPALRWYVTRQAEAAGLKAEFDTESLQGRLDPVIETECFRVTQEALTNVIRHSKATGVSVRLTSEDAHLHLSVQDDGSGFDVATVRDKAVRGASLGLLSMEERAERTGGGLEFRSAPGRGS